MFADALQPVNVSNFGLLARRWRAMVVHGVTACSEWRTTGCEAAQLPSLRLCARRWSTAGARRR